MPVCAPSANRFGHVSPTRAGHVLKDLAFEDVVVIQDEATGDDLCCSVGIESTVVKVDPSTQTLTVLRRGAVSPLDLRRQLPERGFYSWVVHCQDFHLSEKAQQPQEAPGQLIRHYAPDVETYMISPLDTTTTISPSSYLPPPGTVIIDCGSFLSYLRGKQDIVGYTDLSQSGNAREAASTLFQKLRWAESIPGVKRIVIVQCRPDNTCEGMAEAINDRIFRAACGRTGTMSAMYS